MKSRPTNKTLVVITLLVFGMSCQTNPANQLTNGEVDLAFEEIFESDESQTNRDPFVVEVEALIQKTYKTKDANVYYADKYDKYPFLENVDLYEVTLVTFTVPIRNRILPSIQGIGLFLRSASAMESLSKNDIVIGDLLTKHLVGNPEMHKEEILKFLYQNLLAETNERFFIIHSIEDLRAIEKNGYKGDESYKLSDEALERIATRNFPTEADWKALRFHFYVVSGWMHNINTLSEITIVFDRASNKLLHNRTIVTQNLFETSPEIDY